MKEIERYQIWQSGIPLDCIVWFSLYLSSGKFRTIILKLGEVELSLHKDCFFCFSPEVKKKYINFLAVFIKEVWIPQDLEDTLH